MSKSSSPNTPAAPSVRAMRLTNAMRESFVSAVMADVPKADYEQMIRDQVAKEHAAAVPTAVKKMLADPSAADWIKQCGCTLRRSDGLPSGAFVSFHMPAPSDEWLEAVAEKAAATHGPAWCEQIERHDRLKQSLSVAADRCTTTTQLADVFPEFAQYLPKSDADATRSLPAIANLVTEFTRAGWPKGKKES